MSDPALDRERIADLLLELGRDLDLAGVRAELFLVGGAALALVYNTRRMTADVDAVFEPKQVVYDAARRVAANHPGLPADWLNDGVKGFLPGPDLNARAALDAPGIVVSAASPEYLLALKVQASRIDRDADDIRLLAGLCVPPARTSDEVLAVAERVIGRERLTAKAQYLVQSMFPAGIEEG